MYPKKITFKYSGLFILYLCWGRDLSIKKSNGTQVVFSRLRNASLRIKTALKRSSLLLTHLNVRKIMRDAQHFQCLCCDETKRISNIS